MNNSIPATRHMLFIIASFTASFLSGCAASTNTPTSHGHPAYTNAAVAQQLRYVGYSAHNDQSEKLFEQAIDDSGMGDLLRNWGNRNHKSTYYMLLEKQRNEWKLAKISSQFPVAIQSNTMRVVAITDLENLKTNIPNLLVSN